MSEVKKQTKARGFVTLDSCIRGALMSIGESMSRYEQFRHYAIKAFRKFQFDLAQEVRTVELDLTAWKAYEIPIDCVDIVMFGVRINNVIRVFTSDDRISLFHEATDGYPEDITSLETLPETEGENANPETLTFWNGSNGNTGQLYGLVTKSNGNGYYKINTERREIQMAPSIKTGTKGYLEYIADAVDPCEASVIHVYAAEFIELYIHWQRLKYSKSSSLGAIDMAYKDAMREFGVVQNRIQKITVEDVLECARDGYRMTPWI